MKSQSIVFAAFAAAAAVISACASHDQPATKAAPITTARIARATLVDVGGNVEGNAIFTESAQGVKMDVEVSDLSPGHHGIHVHQGNTCGPSNSNANNDTNINAAANGNSGHSVVVAFGAAGPHFDPDVTRLHGGPDSAAVHSHAGDLPNLLVNLDGNGRANFTLRRVTIEPGSRSVVGRTLVVHADRDDYSTNPAGNSGGRVLCGEIRAGG